VGSSSWTDPTLLKSGFYPKKSMSAEDRLRHYASRFPLVEVDATYYRLPSERNADLWVERTSKGFVFNVKAFGLLTQHPVERAAVPPDLTEEIAPDHREKKRIYLEHLSADGRAEVWRRFLAALEPLRTADRLGCLLFQFPQWMPGGPRNREYIAECVRAASPDRVAVEFRHKSWMEGDWAERSLQFLESVGASYVCVDEPQGFDSSIPGVVAATTDLAFVRFNGRNTETWEKKGITAAERFAYDYSDKELEEWAPKVEALAREAKEVHVLFNNCYSDYSVRNAATLAQILRGE